MEQEGITVGEYVAQNNPRGLNALIMSKGFSPATDMNDLLGKLASLHQEEPEETESSLLVMHPDREDIINHYLSTHKEQTTQQPQTEHLGIKSNADGCGENCKCGGKHSNVCGCNKKSGADATTTTDNTQVSQPLPQTQDHKQIIYIGIGVLAIIAIYKLIQ